MIGSVPGGWDAGAGRGAGGAGAGDTPLGLGGIGTLFAGPAG